MSRNIRKLLRKGMYREEIREDAFYFILNYLPNEKEIKRITDKRARINELQLDPDTSIYGKDAIAILKGYYSEKTEEKVDTKFFTLPDSCKQAVKNLRRKGEIADLINRIDKKLDENACDGECIEYLRDIKNALQWVLKKTSMISTNQERKELGKKMKEISAMSLGLAEMSEKQFNEFREFMDKEFDRNYNKRDPYVMCNIGEAFDWVLEEISTKEYLSQSYLGLE